MFHDLDTTIKRILDDPPAPQQLREAEVSFETPKQGYAPAQQEVNLFLHQVKENLELRDLVPIRSQVGGVTQQRRPPLRVDCTYMVSAWSPNANATGVVEEHRLLGQALLWLSRFPTIPPGYLAGALVGQPFPAPTLVAQLDGDRHSGEFWSALGIAPRPTFSLTVTIALDLDVPITTGPPVTSIEGIYIVGDGTPERVVYQQVE
jgi:hypothetical protein